MGFQGSTAGIQEALQYVPHLLIYANFEANVLDPVRLAAACRQWAAPFDSIWVLWAYQIVQLFDSKAFGRTDLVWCSVGFDPWAQNEFHA